MCGNVGYIGSKQACPILIKGLRRLEYRGYDSAGVSMINDRGELNVFKAKGKVDDLVAFLDDKDVSGTIGIAHTRWATHGEPSTINSHPHTSMSGRLALVHNGIIENYIELKEFLTSKGRTFLSDTDTEVVAQLLDYKYNGNPLETIDSVMGELHGSFALGIMFKDFPDRIYAVRRESPLNVGVADGESFIASDVPAILKYSNTS